MTDQPAKPPILGQGKENPQQWVAYLQEMLNWFYGMQVVSQDGDFGHHTRNAVKHLRGQLGLSAEPVVDARLWKELEGAGAADDGDGIGEPVDVAVTLVPGDAETSWAAAIAMVASANDNPQTIDTVLATSPQRGRTATEARALAAERFGLREQACHASRAESWAGVLRAHGALWVQVPGDEYHVFVVAGIRADGDVVHVHVLDPRTGYDAWADFAAFCAGYHLTQGADIQVLAAR
ncbi:papain-like cysteine protease family protein [Actinophytocola sediminis]